MRRTLAVLATLVAAGCTSSATHATTTAPDPADLAAAKACKTWSEYVAVQDNKAKSGPSGQDVLNATSPLLAGTAEASGSSLPAPKWSQLGGDIVTSTGDIADANNPASAAKIGPDGNKVLDECASVPKAADAAVGYTPPRAS